MEPYPGGTSSDLEAMSGNTILGERSRRDHLFGKNKSGYIRISQRAQIPYISIFYGLN